MTGENTVDASSPVTLHDPLLDCLAYVARHFDRPFSSAAVMNALPVRDHALTADLFERAAERIGLQSKLVHRRIGKISSLVLPAILPLANGDACVLLRKKGKRSWQVVFPSISDKPRTVKAAELEKESMGTVFFVTPSDSVSAGQSRQSHARDSHWFWSNVLPFWPSWMQIAIAAMLINTLALAFPLFVMNVYDRVIPSLSIPTLWALSAGVAIALVFDFILKQMRAIILDRAARRVDMRVSALLYEQALAVSMDARQEASGGIASKIREFETVRDFFTSSSIIAITDLIFIGIFLAVLWMIVGPITYVPMVAVPLVLVVTFILQFPLAHAVRRSQRHSGRRHQVLVDGLVGVETIKALSSEGYMQRQWEDASAAAARANSAVKSWSSLATYFTGSVQQLVGIIVIIWGVFLVSDGTITVGGLIAASILSGRVLAPLGNIVMTLARAQHAFGALRELSTFMKLDSDKRDNVQTGLGIETGALEFRGVDFTYAGATQPALRQVSFSIAAGERVGIVGKVGSGKSSIGKLLAGFYVPTSGSILFDGIESRHYEMAELRSAVGYVSQDSELFAGTIRQNILMANPAASEEQVAQVTRIAGVDAFASSHPLGLNLPVGERGQGLSGGQRQAIALARMLLRRPKLLFLDEPSSAMDTATEAELIAALEHWTINDQTLIVCSHRVSFLRLVDRLIVVDNGSVVADGPRDQVLNALSGNSNANSNRSAEGSDGRS